MLSLTRRPVAALRRTHGNVAGFVLSLSLFSVNFSVITFSQKATTAFFLLSNVALTIAFNERSLPISFLSSALLLAGHFSTVCCVVSFSVPHLGQYFQLQYDASTYYHIAVSGKYLRNSLCEYALPLAMSWNHITSVF